MQGSLGALVDAFGKPPQDEVRIRVIHSGVGAINESDVGLALASQAVVIGFNVRPDAKAKEMADKEGVDVRLYRVIYEAIDDVRQALSGLLAPGEEEAELGRAEVRATFRVPKMGVVAGCYVRSGTIARGAIPLDETWPIARQMAISDFQPCIMYPPRIGENALSSAARLGRWAMKARCAAADTLPLVKASIVSAAPPR